MPSDPYVPLIVIGVIVVIVFLAGRPKTDTGSAAPEPPSGPELIERLQQTLGIAVIVESIESTSPNERVDHDAVTIRASFMFGSHTQEVTVTGEVRGEGLGGIGRIGHHLAQLGLPAHPHLGQRRLTGTLPG